MPPDPRIYNSCDYFFYADYIRTFILQLFQPDIIKIININRYSHFRRNKTQIFLYFGLNLYNATQTRCKMKVFMKLQTLNLKLQHSDTLTWRIRVMKYNSNRSILKSFVFSKCFKRKKLHGSCYIKKDSLLLFNLLWWLLVFENSGNSNGNRQGQESVRCKIFGILEYIC